MLLLTNLGFTINHEKTIYPFLGVNINTINGSLAIPMDKIIIVQSELIFWLEIKKATKIQLQSLLRKLSWIARTINP